MMLTKEDAEAMARAQVLESAAKVGKLLADIQVTLTKLREANETGGDKSPS